MPLVVWLVFWLTTIFISFGLFAPRNATVITSPSISGLSVSGAILMILELYSPYAGLIRISSAPVRAAVALLGQ
jgi:ACR3 family arsenite efflux pump ArsB